MPGPVYNPFESLAPQAGSQANPLDVFYGVGGTTGNKTTNKDLPQWLLDLGMKGDAYAGGMLKPELRYGFKYKDGKINFADGTSYEAKKVKDKKTKQVTYQYTDATGNAKTYDPTDEEDTYNKKYQNATANQSVMDKLGATADRTQAHVHDIFHGAGQALQGKGSIFGGTPLGTKLSNAVTGRHDKPITDQYGGPTKESQAKYVEENGAGALGYQPQLHALGSAIGSAAAGAYGVGQLGALGQAAGLSEGVAGGLANAVGQAAPYALNGLFDDGTGAPGGAASGVPGGPGSPGASGYPGTMPGSPSTGTTNFPKSGFRDDNAFNYLLQTLGLPNPQNAPVQSAGVGPQAIPDVLDSFSGMDFSQPFKAMFPQMSSPKMDPAPAFTAMNPGTRGPDADPASYLSSLAGAFGNGGAAMGIPTFPTAPRRVK